MNTPTIIYAVVGLIVLGFLTGYAYGYLSMAKRLKTWRELANKREAQATSLAEKYDKLSCEYRDSMLSVPVPVEGTKGGQAS